MRRFLLKNLKTLQEAEQLETALRENKKLEGCRVHYVSSLLEIPVEKLSRKERKELMYIVHKVNPEIEVEYQNQYGMLFDTCFFLLFLICCLFSIWSHLFSILAFFLGIIALWIPFHKNQLQAIPVFFISLVYFFFHKEQTSILFLLCYHMICYLETLFFYFVQKHNHISWSEFTNKKQEKYVVKVPIKEIQVDDVIYIKKNEIVPLDGILLDGKSRLGPSFLIPWASSQQTKIHMEIKSGVRNLGGVIALQVIHDYAHSRIVNMLEYERNHPEENPLDKKIKRFFTIDRWILVLVFLCMIFYEYTYPQDRNLFLFFLPLFLLFSTGKLFSLSHLLWKNERKRLRTHGILMRNLASFAKLRRLKTWIFDLEQTLSYGKPVVAKIVNETRYPEEELLYYAACCEEYSITPVAMAIKHRYGKRIDTSKIKQYQEFPGLGVKAEIEDHLICVGNENLLTKYGIWIDTKVEEIGTVLHVAIDKEYAGYFVIHDEIKEEFQNQLPIRKQLGLKNIKILSSESEEIGTYLCRQLEVKDALFHLSLSDKRRAIERYAFEEKKSYAFVSTNESLLQTASAHLKIMVVDTLSWDTSADILVQDCSSLKVLKKSVRTLRLITWFGISLFVLLQLLSILAYYFFHLSPYCFFLIYFIPEIYYICCYFLRRA